MPSAKRKIVLGLGNILNRDEGLGVHALRILQKEIEGKTAFECLDGGVLGLDLLPLVENSSHLLVLDAIQAGKPAGTLLELDKREIPLFRHIKLSEHQITFQEVLGLAQIRDKMPAHLILLGIQPDDLSIGTELSPLVQQSVDALISRAKEILVQWDTV
jgi:hydrogenase maturation protease